MDFWIGDWVRNKKTGKTGKFEGLFANGKAKIKIGSKHYLVPAVNLEGLNKKEIELLEESLRKLSVKEPKIKKISKDFDPVLDLHVNKLAPHLDGKQPEMILLHQLDKARNFIETAIDKHQLTVKLIHGKGTGALKMEIEHMLADYDEILFQNTIHNGGAIEILFKY
jgi:dsDNA-specific endonuclease/ATPase MutS2